MSDVVVTVPKGFWGAWLSEGDLPGQKEFGCYLCEGQDDLCTLCMGTGRLKTGQVEWDFYLGHANPPKIDIGERVYIVAHGLLRGYAPLVGLRHGSGGWSLVRKGGAVAVTIEDPVRGFPGWRYRWWNREDEKPFPDWKTKGVEQ